MRGVERSEVGLSQVVRRYTILELKDKFALMYAAFGEEQYKVDATPSVRTEYYSWRGKKDPDSKERNVQVDIIIERADRIINLCEVKYTSEDEYELTTEEKEKIQKRVSKFKKETGTKYGIVPTLLTTYGLKPGINSGAVKRTITMFDLFK